MAKNDKAKDVQDVQNDAVPDVQPQVVEEVQDVVVQAQPVAMPEPVPAPLMPVENQQALHDAARDPNQALMPGRDEQPAHQGVVGELEALARKAEVESEHEIAAALQQLLVKLGEVYRHMADVEQKIGARLKPHFDKVIALFNK